MLYLIGRDVDNDGYPEFIMNMDSMTLTEDPRRALQVTDAELSYIDMPYLNSMGFYAIEAPRYNVSPLASLLFRPPVRSYRPRVTPPPRKPRPVGPVAGGPNRGPAMGGRGPAGGPGMGGHGGPAGNPGMGGHGGPGMGGRGPAGGPGMGGQGGRGPGGMGGQGGRGPGMGGPGGHPGR